MTTLLVDNFAPRLRLWSKHLIRQGLSVVTAGSGEDAYLTLNSQKFDAMVLNMGLPDGEALSISDFAIFRNPEIRIIAVTSDRFFSDGTLFNYIPNLRTHVADTVQIEDLTAAIYHYAHN
ncbi:MAG: response regulator [Pseudomonadota bacterium]